MSDQRPHAVIVCPPDRVHAPPPVGGLTLLERLFRQFSDLGIADITVVHRPGTVVPAPSPRVRARVHTVESTVPSAWGMASAAMPPNGGRAVIVAGDLVVDHRLLTWLVARPDDALLARAPASPPDVAGTLAPTTVRALAAGQPAGPTVMAASEFPTYSASHRGDVPVHLLRVTDARTAAHASTVLLDWVDKRTKDLPAILFDPPFENFLVRRFAPTRITPNQITVFTTVLAFGVAGLFWHGWLRLGIVLAIVVEVLDGVDGKLARLKRQTSKFGEYEHVFDFFYEMAWWLSLGRHLAGRGTTWAWPAALVVCASDLADNLAYIAFRRAGRGNLDEATPLLSRFRMIAGRRNIYAWLLLPGIALGAPAVSFATVTAWAALTAGLHWAQVVVQTRRPPPGDRPPA